jgi:F0F1-type ATP synthase assembly protein I
MNSSMDSETGAEVGGKEADSDGRRLTPCANAAIMPPLFKADVQENRLARRIIGLQILVVLAAAGIAIGSGSSPQKAIAVVGGGGASVLNGALLAWRMSRAALYPAHGAHHQLRLMYFCAAERFLAVVTSLGICLAVLKLSPLAVLGGFVLGQAALLSARLLLNIKIESGAKNVQ